jgi:hypothetical protein
MKLWNIQTKHAVMVWFGLALISSYFFTIRYAANGGIFPIPPEINIDDAPILAQGASRATRDNHLNKKAQGPFNKKKSSLTDKDAKISNKKAYRVQPSAVIEYKEQESRQEIRNHPIHTDDSTNGASSKIHMRKRMSSTLAPPPVKHDVVATEWNMRSRDQNQSSSLETSTTTTTTTTTTSATIAKKEGRCALLFFGLPRAFQKLVLPSMLQYVIRPHAKYNCDVFVHYYNKTKEPQGRMNQGGNIDPQEILLLKTKVPETYKEYHDNRKLRRRRAKSTNITPPIVSMIYDTDETFAALKQDTIELWTNTTNPDGNYTFFKNKEGYIYPLTMMNIMKQWHSIESVWNLMQDTASKHHIDYSRVGMFRLDVMYVTYINIYKLNHSAFDTGDDYAVYPIFSPPMNDRMFYGPKATVELWATRRWARAQAHARKFEGISPEMFLYQEIRPLMINEYQQKLFINPDICFVRVRADLSVHAVDCQIGAASSVGNVSGKIQRLAGGPGKIVGNLLLFNETLLGRNESGSV